MNRTGLIIQREFLSRVKKKSFVVMTLLGPILMASLFIVPILLAESGSPQKEVLVLDETDLFEGYLAESPESRYTYLSDIDLDSAKAQLKSSEAYALLYVPCGANCDLNYIEKSIQLYSEKTVSLDMKYGLKRQLERELENLKLRRDSVDLEKIEAAKTSVNISTISLEGEKEEENYSELTTAVGFVMAFLIYIFIFIYGSQVMRGVIEEKSNRIVEVIISSVKPFQLMLGKIVGVALVGLTQFLLWVVLTFAIVSVIQYAYLDDAYSSTAVAGQMAGPGGDEVITEMQNNEMPKIMKMMDSINFPLIIGSFLFYFMGGYLLYGALFAAIGAAVDNESDTQQFMLPVTVPLILAIIVAQTVMTNPESPVAFWFSLIPFTSPVIMMVRVAMGVPVGELILSMGLLVLGFFGTVWVAARIYRTGILMYGKKVSYKELWKWIRFKG